GWLEPEEPNLLRGVAGLLGSWWERQQQRAVNDLMTSIPLLLQQHAPDEAIHLLEPELLALTGSRSVAIDLDPTKMVSSETGEQLAASHHCQRGSLAIRVHERIGGSWHLTQAQLQAIATELHQALLARSDRMALDVAEARHRQLIEQLNDGVVVLTTANGGHSFTVQEVNESMRHRLPGGPRRLTGRALSALGLDDFGVEEAARQCWLTGEDQHLSIRIDGTDGQQRYEALLSKLPNQDVVAVVEDLTELQRSQSELQYLVDHDAITELPNRRTLLATLEAWIKRASRTDLGVAALVVDLDNFRDINDSLGHAVGDRLLREVGARIKEQMRSSDLVGHLVGDEFIVALPDQTSDEDTLWAIRRISEGIAEPFHVAGVEVRVTATLGAARYPADTAQAAELINRAAAAKGRAKAVGRGGFAFYDEELTQQAQRRLAVAVALSQAARRSELHVQYQPQVQLTTKQIVGFEALLRWHSDTLGTISPGEFIPYAEKSGMITELDDWVLREVLQQARQWRDAGVEFGRIAVNVSAIDVSRPGFAERILAELGTNEVPGDCLEVEITESVLIGPERDIVDTNLAALRAEGVRVAIDDFGTGYSSLSAVARLPIDRLKIDQSFVTKLPASRNELAVLESILHLAEQLDLEVIAEGIETATQAALLQARSCDLGQGFFFAEPLDVNAASDLLQSQQPLARID
nr:bifunctional diguanylate cyclase/phosphodiesterase [Actinomycetes bacterium]